MIKRPERLLWAREVLNIKPNDNILEIGCGAGLMSELIADRLKTGRLLAIDKSVPMLEKAKKRNKGYIENGRSEFIATDLSNSNLPGSYFDSIIAFNVNFFWKDPVKELRIISKTVKRHGKLYVFYQAPFEINITAAEPIEKKLIDNSYTIVDIQLKKLMPTSAICIIAKAKDNI